MKLQDISFYYIVKNFAFLMERPRFCESFKNRQVPYSICNDIFNALNDYYNGMSDGLIEMFDKESFQLTDIRYSDRNLSHSSKHKFLEGHKFKSLTFDYLVNSTVEDVLELVDGEELNSLSIHSCMFSSELYTNSNKRRNGQKGYSKPRFLKIYPNLKHLTVLSVSNCLINDIQFFFITKEVNSLINVNISATNITDIRLLKKHTNLQYLDCSYLKESAEKNFVHLHCFKNLRKLRFGNPEIPKSKIRLGWSSYINPFYKHFITRKDFEQFRQPPKKFAQKENWYISGFLELADWKDLEFLDVTGKWDPSLRGVRYAQSIKIF